MTTPIITVLRELIVDRFDVPAEGLDNDTPFTVLGLDSLGLVDFMFQVEDRFQVVIDYDQAMVNPTLNGLARLVALLQGPIFVRQAA